MSQFVLKSSESAGMTSISNYFLDYYMPRANGEYVKVYLYLLRALNRPDLALSVAGLADALDRTEVTFFVPSNTGKNREFFLWNAMHPMYCRAFISAASRRLPMNRARP